MPRCGCITSSTYTATEGAAWFGVSALPTVVFNEKVSLVGAVPEESYRWLLDWLLAQDRSAFWLPVPGHVVRTWMELIPPVAVLAVLVIAIGGEIRRRRRDRRTF